MLIDFRAACSHITIRISGGNGNDRRNSQRNRNRDQCKLSRLLFNSLMDHIIFSANKLGEYNINTNGV